MSSKLNVSEEVNPVNVSQLHKQLECDQPLRNVWRWGKESGPVIHLYGEAVPRRDNQWVLEQDEVQWAAPQQSRLLSRIWGGSIFIGQHGSLIPAEFGSSVLGNRTWKIVRRREGHEEGEEKQGEVPWINSCLIFALQYFPKEDINGVEFFSEQQKACHNPSPVGHVPGLLRTKTRCFQWSSRRYGICGANSFDSRLWIIIPLGIIKENLTDFCHRYNDIFKVSSKFFKGQKHHLLLWYWIFKETLPSSDRPHIKISEANSLSGRPKEQHRRGGSNRRKAAANMVCYWTSSVCGSLILEDPKDNTGHTPPPGGMRVVDSYIDSCQSLIINVPTLLACLLKF